MPYRFSYICSCYLVFVVGVFLYLFLFKQIDTRVLRAVAIENSKDSQAAVKVVLEEIIPFLPVQSESFNSANEINSCSFEGTLSICIGIELCMNLLYEFTYVHLIICRTSF